MVGASGVEDVCSFWQVGRTAWQPGCPGHVVSVLSGYREIWGVLPSNTVHWEKSYRWGRKDVHYTVSSHPMEAHFQFWDFDGKAEKKENKLVSPISTSLSSLPHMSYFRSPSIHTFLDLLAHLLPPFPISVFHLSFPRCSWWAKGCLCVHCSGPPSYPWDT